MSRPIGFASVLATATAEAQRRRRAQRGHGSRRGDRPLRAVLVVGFAVPPMGVSVGSTGSLPEFGIAIQPALSTSFLAVAVAWIRSLLQRVPARWHWHVRSGELGGDPSPTGSRRAGELAGASSASGPLAIPLAVSSPGVVSAEQRVRRKQPASPLVQQQEVTVVFPVLQAQRPAASGSPARARSGAGGGDPLGAVSGFRSCDSNGSGVGSAGWLRRAARQGRSGRFDRFAP